MTLNAQAAVFKERAERAEQIAHKLFEKLDGICRSIGDDNLAITMQNIAQYRSALYREIGMVRDKEYLINRAEIEIQIAKGGKENEDIKID